METMGQVFRAARERKRVSLSQAAMRTRIKLQHLEMMERDDYSRMPAPTYARGFIRMYAGFLELEAGPLIEEYDQLHQPGARGRAEPARAGEAAGEPAGRPASERLNLSAVLAVFSPLNVKRAAVVVALLLAVGFLVTGVSRCVREAQQSGNTPHAPALRKGVPAVLQEPAEPYLPIPDSSGETR